MEHIETRERQVNVNITQKMPKQKKKSISANSFILSAVVTISLLVVAALFAEYADIDIGLSLRSLTVKAVMIAIGIFSIGYLIKKYSINESRRSEEYLTAKKNAQIALDEISKENMAVQIPIYCEEYSKNAQLSERVRFLEDCGLTYEKFKADWLGKSTKDIVRDEYNNYCKTSKEKKIKRWLRFHLLKKERDLTSTQLYAIKCANGVKYDFYDPDFLRDNEWEKKSNLVPSSEYNTLKANTKDNLLSSITGLLSVVFGAYFGGSIAFSFSIETLYMAIIEVLIIFFNVVLKYLVGRKLVVMEISRYNLKISEVKNYKIWYDERIKSLTPASESDIIE